MVTRLGLTRAVVSCGLLSFALLVIGCDGKRQGESATSAPAATAGQPITIGAISPFTGDGAPYGMAARTAIDLAVDEINAAGGIKGRNLVVVYEDDLGTPAGALNAFEKLVTVDKVPAILGPFYSGNVLAIAPKANDRKVVVLTGSATSDNIRTAGEFVFRTCPSNDAQAKTIAQFAVNELKLRKSFVVYRNVEYGVTLRDAFLRAAEGLGINNLGVEAVAADSRDVRAQLTKVKAANPDFIFAAVHYPEGGTLLREAKELGISATVIGTDGGFDPQLLRIAGNAADNSYWVTVGWGDENTNPAVARFKASYHRRYQEDPGVYSGLYYDATRVLARALIITPTPSGPAIQRALATVEYDGPTGITKFDSFGDVDKPFTVYRVLGNAFVPYVPGISTTQSGGNHP
jgi:branched-chain amino acid transport system substrate-binding protein